MERPSPEPLVEATKLRFSGFVLEFDRQRLLQPDGSPTELRPQVYEVLQVLARHTGQLVTKAELMETVWPGIVVTDDSLVQAVSDLRHALGRVGHEVIRTVPRRGYMLLAGAEPTVPPQTAAQVERSVNSAEHDECTEAAAPARVAKAYPLRAAVVWLVAVLLVVAAGTSYLSRDRTTASAQANISRPGIAVLAFNGGPNDSDGDALARAVAGDLASELARSPEIRVMSSQSSFRLQQAAMSTEEIGRRLRSRYIVDGSVQREGESLRLKIVLLDSQAGRILWTVTPLVDRTTLGQAERDLVSRVAGTLQSRVSRTEQTGALEQPPKTLDVFVLTAKAKAAMQRYDADGIRRSRDLLGQALAIDAKYALAWALLGITNTIDMGLHLTGEWDRSRGEEALAQIQRAISLQSDLPIAYVALSDVQGLLGDFDAALAAGEHCHTL